MPEASEGENAAALQSDLAAGAIFDVSGKVVAISGGGSGIGAMLAAGFCANGARVYIFSRKETAPFAASLSARGPGSCVAVRADLQNDKSLSGLVRLIGDREGRLDVLVNNAGTNYNAPLADVPRKAFEKVVDVNLTSLFRLTQLCEPLLRQSEAGRVINIASVYGLDPPAMPTHAYSSSKAAVVMLTRHLAIDLAPAITVNALCPGPFHSRMMRATLAGDGEAMAAQGTLLKRVGGPVDIVGAALLLASRAGGYITGVALPVEGGVLLSKM